MAKVKKTRTCWIWTGCLDKFGYGRFQDGTSQLAHKWMMEHQLHRKIDWVIDRETVNHTCKRRDCVKPAHLYVGTQWDNVQDALADGTHRNLHQKSLCYNKLHPATENYRTKKGHMRCRPCLTAANRRARLRRQVDAR